MSQPYRVGVDIGGTFTDLIVVNQETGAFAMGKVLTSSDDPSRAVEEALVETLRQAGIAPEAVRHLVHGTTLVTNALIERKGAPTALLTTAGFRDSVAIGREQRYDLYDLLLEQPRRLCRATCASTCRSAPWPTDRPTPRWTRPMWSGWPASWPPTDRGGGDRLPAQLHQPRRRAGRPRRRAARRAGHPGIDLVGRGARDPRVRAGLHHHRQCLRSGAGGALPAHAAGAAAPARPRRRFLSDALVGRDRHGGHGRALPACGCSSRARRQGRWRPLSTARRPISRTCSRLTWAAPPPRSA